MLQILWGDDEHTGADGAYVRVLRSRKWIYFAAGVTVLHSYEAIDFAALGRVLKGVLAVPPWMATLSLQFGLAYLLVQYVALLVQFGSAYTSIIMYRLPDNQNQVNARQGIFNTQQEIDDIIKRNSNPGEDIGTLRAQMDTAERKMAFYVDNLAKATKAQPTARRLFRFPEYFIDWGRALLPLIVGTSALLRLCRVMPGF